MELLIMVSACKGGSSRSITGTALSRSERSLAEADSSVAVLPYFPYARQSKKKSHRGAITARMIASQLEVAGVNHVITIDLHASQMQGFFRCPVDNLVAEPLLAHWIRLNVQDWKRAVVVSKNPGGTKRTTSLADALKTDFGIIMTDRARPNSGRTSLNNSTIFEGQCTPKQFNAAHDENSKHTSDHSTASESSSCEKAFSFTRTQTAPSASQSTRVDGTDELRETVRFLFSVILALIDAA